MKREAREQQEKVAQDGHEDPPSAVQRSEPFAGEVELIQVEDDAEDPEGCSDGREVFGTPEKPAAQRDAEGGDAGQGLKPNGDPVTPGATPSTGGLQS